MVTLPEPKDWRFDEIARSCPQRAESLEPGIESAALTDQLAKSIVAGIKGSARYGRDCHSKSGHPRIILQIPVTRDLYDHFYNGRSGYRAHYWVSPDVGNDFDQHLVCLLRQAITDHMRPTVNGRRIEVKFDNSRDEYDVGQCPITRDFALQSLVPESSKVWICERLITGEMGCLPFVLFPYMVHGPKLIVDKWKTSQDGLCAPCGGWLDSKGGFVDESGKAMPSKDRNDRAKKLNETGWTPPIVRADHPIGWDSSMA
jgi:hypothetical protein